MRVKSVFFVFLLTGILLFIACDINQDGDPLNVWFANHKNSTYNISSLIIKTSNGNKELIADGKTLKPAEYIEFSLNLEKGEKVEYRITVVSNENTFEFEKDDAEANLTIMRWSESTRFAYVVVADAAGVPKVVGQGDSDFFFDDDEEDYTKAEW